MPPIVELRVYSTTVFGELVHDVRNVSATAYVSPPSHGSTSPPTAAVNALQASWCQYIAIIAIMAFKY